MDTGDVPPSSSPLGSPRFSADDQQTIYRYMRAVADHLDPSAVARKGMNELFVRTSWWFPLEKSAKNDNPESESESEPELELIASPEERESGGAAIPSPKALPDLARCLWDSCTGTIAARDLESVRTHFTEAHPEGRRWFGSERIVCRWAECARWDYMERRRVPGHVIRMHLREHECPFRTCGMVFGSKDDVRVHLQLVHDGSE
ncbi:uncharacterized protein LAESUDRAFT_730634 [Laetiporus sulphureus 93-53]|uniref:C2H2-type domain-containing protein n=1 Tax=Laetiporus sulphureus 93-53 TaxID=1314785 RepID=A0A165BZL1_9APHY|nr:uncharacterized protein LAESUDRAFT_730634 [Laetiporus sulphureus 93-53]KZT01937.1 hypothetical protein LAESUDRAFT_730634 [Laetiporus sulphureus 93-53]